MHHPMTSEVSPCSPIGQFFSHVSVQFSYVTLYMA